MTLTSLIQTQTLLETKEIIGDIIVVSSSLENLLTVDGLKYLEGQETTDSEIRSCLVMDGESVKVIITETGRGKRKKLKVFTPEELKKEIKTVYSSVKTVASKLNIEI
jgi:hypothetical protein